ncbi:uncharacterized protein [Vicugna pacos]|uniref:Uncharacterized protein n=1 Tax=Vicugna pacos TaxID=30538 RepID=A0ABM5C6N3_VICPA
MEQKADAQVVSVLGLDFSRPPSDLLAGNRKTTGKRRLSALPLRRPGTRVRSLLCLLQSSRPGSRLSAVQSVGHPGLFACLRGWNLGPPLCSCPLSFSRSASSRRFLEKGAWGANFTSSDLLGTQSLSLTLQGPRSLPGVRLQGACFHSCRRDLQVADSRDLRRPAAVGSHVRLGPASRCTLCGSSVGKTPLHGTSQSCSFGLDVLAGRLSRVRKGDADLGVSPNRDAAEGTVRMTMFCRIKSWEKSAVGPALPTRDCCGPGLGWRGGGLGGPPSRPVVLRAGIVLSALDSDTSEMAQER